MHSALKGFLSGTDVFPFSCLLPLLKSHAKSLRFLCTISFCPQLSLMVSYSWESLLSTGCCFDPPLKLNEILLLSPYIAPCSFPLWKPWKCIITALRESLSSTKTRPCLLDSACRSSSYHRVTWHITGSEMWVSGQDDGGVTTGRVWSLSSYIVLCGQKTHSQLCKCCGDTGARPVGMGGRKWTDLWWNSGRLGVTVWLISPLGWGTAQMLTEKISISSNHFYLLKMIYLGVSLSF